MPYVDGFVLAVPKDKIDAYKALARTACEVWMEYGALDYVECIGDDVPYGDLTSFPRAVMAKEDEVVVFSWIVYRDRESRDAVNKKVMEDPRLKGGDMPFDGKRMICGRVAWRRHGLTAMRIHNGLRCPTGKTRKMSVNRRR
jgi:uncharacterized protein YbaA (DUF1428 family)